MQLRSAIELVASNAATARVVKIGRPATEDGVILTSRGSFASPVIQGYGDCVSEQLTHALRHYFRAPLNGLMEELRVLCGAFRQRAITAQVLGKFPEGGAGGYCNDTHRFHRDFNPSEPRQELVRLVRAYIGAGSDYIAEDDRTISTTPPDGVLVFRGGLRRGLLHRSAPVELGRIIIIVSHALPIAPRSSA